MTYEDVVVIIDNNNSDIIKPSVPTSNGTSHEIMTSIIKETEIGYGAAPPIPLPPPLPPPLERRPLSLPPLPRRPPQFSGVHLMYRAPPRPPNEICSIYRVPHRVCEVKKIAYEPNVISIGPYHHDKKHLRPMNDVKRRSFAEIVNRKNLELDELKHHMRTFKDEALKCYEGLLGGINDESGEIFLEMMIYDGCFIVELIRYGYPQVCKWGRHNQTDTWYDLLLLENQIPFFVLLRLNYMIYGGDPYEFIRKALSFFQIDSFGPQIWSTRGTRFPLPSTKDKEPSSVEEKKLSIKDKEPASVEEKKPSTKDKEASSVEVKLPTKDEEPPSVEEKKLPTKDKEPSSVEEKKLSTKDKEPPSVEEKKPTSVEEKKLPTKDEEPSSRVYVHHLLDLVYKCCRPSTRGIEKHQEYVKEIEGQGSQRSWKFIRSATELDDAGIHFSGKKVFQVQDEGLFDITFSRRPVSFKIRKIEFKIPMLLVQKKVLEIPTLTVDHNTERMLRNLLAYEQFNQIWEPTYVYDYVLFMDNLINTDKDVQLLRTKGIIDNWLGDDESVAQMFNKLRDSIYCSKDFYYAEIFDMLNKHCKKKRNKYVAILNKDYFNSPWSFCAFGAALVLLVATLVQTVYTCIGYYHQK